MRRRLLYAADQRWAEMAERLEELMTGRGFHLLKDESRTRAGLLVGPDGVPVFVKRTRTGSWTRGLAAAARGSRARRWLRGAAMLGSAGFNRPAPLAAIEVSRAGAVSDCYLVCEALGGAIVLSRAALGGGTVDFRRRRRLLTAVAREVRRLHDAGLYTRDLQETNLMVEEQDDNRPIISFVDLEDFRRVRSVSWRRRLLNLVHLDRSIGRFLSRSARLRFFDDYLDGATRDRDARRRMVAQILTLSSRMAKRRRAPAQQIAEDTAPPDAAIAGATGVASKLVPPGGR
jgi:tRNA A-37 threonylcarbamoyl transferase component Bud32